MKAEIEQELSHTLLIELLAYQFASPVRWIETQDFLFSTNPIERLIEIGPSPTLSGMAQRTLKTKYVAFDAAKGLQREIFAYSRDGRAIYYEDDDSETESNESEPEKKENATSVPAQIVAPVPVSAPISSPAASQTAVALSDEPVKASEILRCLIAQKLKKTFDDVSPQKAIKDLVGGKSTLQNEILGDLQKEFGSTPDKPEETPLGELAAALQPTFSGDLGPVSSSLISRYIAAKMPGGYGITVVRDYLNTRWGLSNGRQNSLLLLAITSEPPSRLPDVPAAKSYFDALVNRYAAINNITLSSTNASNSGSGGDSGAVIDSAALNKATAEQKKLISSQLEIFAQYLKKDLREGDKKYVTELANVAALQEQLDLWLIEHGEFYASGLKPLFDARKARIYDSYWNWARQDALCMYFDIIFGRLKLVDREILSRCISIINRSTPSLLKFMQYTINHCPVDTNSNYELASNFGKMLMKNCEDFLQSLESKPVYKNVDYPTAPKTKMTTDGNILYEEIPRQNIRKLEHYVTEMQQGGKLTRYTSKDRINATIAQVYDVAIRHGNLSRSNKLQFKAMLGDLCRSLQVSSKNGIVRNDFDIIKRIDSKKNRLVQDKIPFIHLKQKIGETWEYSTGMTNTYLKCLEQAARLGLSFTDKYALITGCGAGSIAYEILIGLISGGANVIVTTSSFSRKTTEYYQSCFARYGSKGSSLVVVPFNQGSKKDVEAIINYIYDHKNGLGWDLDFVLPFAAIPENGIEIDNIGSKSELAHRIMLTNIYRLIGAIKLQKEQLGYDTRPAQVILPLSPNHGIFGSDGLYSESKLALETLFNRWYSESWSQYLTICGAIIGWTRGTGLMSQNNIVSEEIEKKGVRTFSQQEMAFNILGLMAPAIVDLCQTQPVYANLNGGLENLPNLKEIITKIRTNLMQTSEIRRSVVKENGLDTVSIEGPKVESVYKRKLIQPRANQKFEFPVIKDYDTIKNIAPELEGMIDLEKVVVVAGFSEIGPWGNSRTRWEMEAFGEFSLEGCIEMAWIMGLIKHFNGLLKSGQPYSGWVDAKTQEPVNDVDVKAKYEKEILAHSGIRFIEPELFEGYDPKRKMMIQEVQINHNLEPFEASKEEAEKFKHQHHDNVEISEIKETGEWTVRFLKGTTLFIPKALSFDRLVAGQIPTGWDPRHYGIPEDVINQVDPTTLFVLVSAMEAMVNSGITDPYDFYRFMHVSEVGISIGSGIGGTRAIKGMYLGRWQEKDIQKDVLQETFINTSSAWVNMLLMSSAGPIKTPVGACATAVEAVEIACDTILSGKAKVMLAGGYDDFSEEGSYEFANMGATSNAVEELARGREPGEMSRPTTTSRNGFMESQGAGVHVLMQAKVAIEMGVPIYGIIAHTCTATDKEGRSVPAPGKGVLTNARESASQFPSPLLDLSYRKRQLSCRIKQINDWAADEYFFLEEEVAAREFEPEFSADAYRSYRAEHIKSEVKRQIAEAQNSWSNNFWVNDPSIAPLRGCLATWGLTVDDIKVASFHGTSTQANDKNESDVISRQLEHLGRSEGNALLGIFQKYLTGHPKGGAAAWMMNGALQVLNTGLVPGNRNADNIDINLKKFTNIVYPSRSIQTDGIKAVSITSFGFGQVGAQVILVHPDYLFAVLNRETFEEYHQKTLRRYENSYRYSHNAILNNSLIKVKEAPPFTDAQETEVYLNPLARTSYDNKAQSFIFPATLSNKLDSKKIESTESTRRLIESLAKAHDGNGQNVGVDVEHIPSFNSSNKVFIDRNFTQLEQDYCNSSSSPQSSYTGTWAAKEAVFKSLHVKSKGGGASLKDIEIYRDSKGVPQVRLGGEALIAAQQKNLKNFSVSISHDDLQAVSVVLASK